MRAGRVVLVLASLAAALAPGCSSVTSGTGTAAATASSSRPDFPTAPPSPPAPNTSSPSVPPSSTPAAQTPAQRRQALEAQTNGEPNVMIRVPGGFEAATYDQSGGIQFWREPASATSWSQIGTSSYPYVSQIGPPEASVQGALLRNMKNATFIVHGNFTGDGSGNAVAFTTGSKGWGVIKAEPNGNIGPSGQPVGSDQIGLSYDFAFRSGYLETKDCPLDRPISDCDTHPITKLWRWAGDDFVRV